MKIKIPFYNEAGEAGEPIVLDIDSESYKSNAGLVSQAIHVENNHLMVKPGLTKTKGLVSGGGKKPWKQKGTGRARAGSNRSPLWRGGGITFGPTLENKVLSIPKKMRDKAFVLLLVEKAKDNNIAVIESIKLSAPKTKLAQALIGKITEPKSTVLALDETEAETSIAFRNLPLVDIKSKNEVSLNDLNSGKKVLYTKKAFESVKTKIK